MLNKDAVRYPVGRTDRHKCAYSLASLETSEDTLTPLDYIESRQQIYQPIYQSLARQEPQYKELLSKLKRGINLLIIEVDGPHQEDLEYYKDTIGVSDDFIENNTMLATVDNLKIMLNDPKHPYGHGYCLADALLNDLKIAYTH